VEFESSIGHEPQPVTYHVPEPEPGRRMIMTSINESIVQTFEISGQDLDRCTLRLEIRYPQRPGLLGLVDRVIGPMEIERILKQKFDNIELYAATLGANVR
ncbi:MAG: hypothetical protein WKF81_10585, partial [Thermomicrobiales bacterium]